MRKPNLFAGRRKRPERTVKGKIGQGTDSTPRSLFEGERWYDYSLPAIAAKGLIGRAKGKIADYKTGRARDKIATRLTKERAKRRAPKRR